MFVGNPRRFGDDRPWMWTWWRLEKRGAVPQSLQGSSTLARKHLTRENIVIFETRRITRHARLKSPENIGIVSIIYRFFIDSDRTLEPDMVPIDVQFHAIYERPRFPTYSSFSYIVAGFIVT